MLENVDELFLCRPHVRFRALVVGRSYSPESFWGYLSQFKSKYTPGLNQLVYL